MRREQMRGGVLSVLELGAAVAESTQDLILIRRVVLENVLSKGRIAGVETIAQRTHELLD